MEIGKNTNWGGVLDKNNKFVPFSGWMQEYEKVYEFKEKDVCYVDEDVLYLGTLNNCWGHALTDNLRHVWLWSDVKVKEHFLSNRKVIYATVDNKPLTNASKEILKFAGVDVDNVVHISSLTRFKSIAVPSDCIINVEYGFLWSDAYKNIIERIKQTVLKKELVISCPNKLYFTRTRLPQSTRDIGEPSIERVFRKLGYTIISPEKYTVTEQIQMLTHCSHFVTTEGSIAHGTLFCHPGTEVYLLLKAPIFNSYQMMINHMVDLNVIYIDVENSFKIKKNGMFNGPFFIYNSPYLHKFTNNHNIVLPKYFNFYYWAYRFPILARIEHKLRLRFF